MTAARSFTDGLVSLDAAATRQRLAAALVEARANTSGRGGAGVSEAIRHVESVLRESAQWSIRRIDEALAEARAAADRPETLEEAHAAVVAALDSDSPLRADVRPADLAVIAGRRRETPPPGC